MTARTFYWFDYETFGRSPRWDRPAQFAGQRTDLQLQCLGEPDSFHCRLPDDYLPEPGACRITGISPDTVQEHGLCEARFIERVVAHLGAPGTISIGYNSLRFDDEFTRHTLFRNLLDPYAWEWRDGASRWDLLDVMRLTRALRPEGMQWPIGDDGHARNSLEALAAANGVGHTRAHDALSDVEATIGLARTLKAAQPRLFDWLLTHRDKQHAAELLNVRARKVVLLASNRVPRERHNLAAIVPICRHPQRAASVIVLDLSSDPDELVDLDVETLRERIFVRADEPMAAARIGVYAIKLNACPVLAPLETLRPVDAERLGMDRSLIERRRDRFTELLEAPEGLALSQRLVAALERDWPATSDDVDGSLYSGGFLGPADRARLERIRTSAPHIGADIDLTCFDDPRLAEQVFRYRARNWPQTLDAEEREAWLHAAHQRLSEVDAPWMTFERFEDAVADTAWAPDQDELADSLRRFGEVLSERVVPPRS